MTRRHCWHLCLIAHIQDTFQRLLPQRQAILKTLGPNYSNSVLIRGALENLLSKKAQMPPRLGK